MTLKKNAGIASLSPRGSSGSPAMRILGLSGWLAGWIEPDWSLLALAVSLLAASFSAVLGAGSIVYAAAGLVLGTLGVSFYFIEEPLVMFGILVAIFLIGIFSLSFRRHAFPPGIISTLEPLSAESTSGARALIDMERLAQEDPAVRRYVELVAPWAVRSSWVNTKPQGAGRPWPTTGT